MSRTLWDLWTAAVDEAQREHRAYSWHNVYGERK